jgi:hypothetical protein
VALAGTISHSSHSLHQAKGLQFRAKLRAPWMKSALRVNHHGFPPLEYDTSYAFV